MPPTDLSRAASVRHARFDVVIPRIHVLLPQVVVRPFNVTNQAHRFQPGPKRSHEPSTMSLATQQAASTGSDAIFQNAQVPDGLSFYEPQSTSARTTRHRYRSANVWYWSDAPVASISTAWVPLHAPPRDCRDPTRYLPSPELPTAIAPGPHPHTTPTPPSCHQAHAYYGQQQTAMAPQSRYS